MATATREKPQASKTATAVNEKPWENTGRVQVPFFTHEVGDLFQGILRQVETRKEEIKDKKGKVTGDRERLYYHLELTKAAEGNVKKGERKTMQAGELVLLPGSAALDRRIAEKVCVLNGDTAESYDPAVGISDYAPVLGREFLIERLADGIMKKGPNAGNKIKLFNVMDRVL